MWIYICDKQYSSYFTSYKDKVPPSDALPSDIANCSLLGVETLDVNLGL